PCTLSASLCAPLAQNRPVPGISASRSLIAPHLESPALQQSLPWECPEASFPLPSFSVQSYMSCISVLFLPRKSPLKVIFTGVFSCVYFQGCTSRTAGFFQ